MGGEGPREREASSWQKFLESGINELASSHPSPAPRFTEPPHPNPSGDFSKQRSRTSAGRAPPHVFRVDKQGVCAPRLVAPGRAFSADANAALPEGAQRAITRVVRGVPPDRSIK
jgi:hypothetical protein